MEVAQRIAAALRPPIRLDGKEAFLTASMGLAMSVPERGRGRAPRQRRRRALPRQGEGQGPLRDLRAGHAHGGRAPHRARGGPAPGPRARASSSSTTSRSWTSRAGRTVGAEALLRWRHPERGLLPPARVHPARRGERAHRPDRLLGPRGGLPRREPSWSRGGPTPLHISVNLSARQLQETDLVDRVREALRAARLDPARLVLEITESLIMLETRTIIPRLRALKTLGLRLAIDDFGTGYSSLAYLQNLPGRHPEDRPVLHPRPRRPPAGLSPLARGIVDLGKAMRLVMVAEGIEQPEEAEALRSSGCELGQGYHFSRPVPVRGLPEVPRGDGSADDRGRGRCLEDCDRAVPEVQGARRRRRSRRSRRPTSSARSIPSPTASRSS